MKSLKTRLAVLAVAALGAGTAAAQAAPAAESIVVVPEPTVVIVPDSASASMDGSTSPAPDTRSMGAAPSDVNRHGEPVASTVNASTSMSPDLFRSADGTPAALGGGTRMPEGGLQSVELPPAMDENGRIIRGNAQ
jgi:hypothetical protein